MELIYISCIYSYSVNPRLISITNLTCRIARGPFSDVFAINAASATGVVNHEALWSPIAFCRGQYAYQLSDRGANHQQKFSKSDSALSIYIYIYIFQIYQTYLSSRIFSIYCFTDDSMSFGYQISNRILWSILEIITLLLIDWTSLFRHFWQRT